MRHVPHELSAEFPDDQPRINELRAAAGTFARVADRYQEVNQAIHSMESESAPVCRETLSELKTERLHLLNTVATLLSSL